MGKEIRGDLENEEYTKGWEERKSIRRRGGKKSKGWDGKNKEKL
jgi:hypothetical protein